MDYCSLHRDINLIHQQMEKWFDENGMPISPKGIKSQHGLDAAIARPFQSAFGELIFKSPTQQGAALFHGIVANHPFHNGNKRMALMSALAFLQQNGLSLQHLMDDILFDFTVNLASHNFVEKGKDEVSQLAVWLDKNCSRQHRKIITPRSVITLIQRRQSLLKKLAMT